MYHIPAPLSESFTVSVTSLERYPHEIFRQIVATLAHRTAMEIQA